MRDQPVRRPRPCYPKLAAHGGQLFASTGDTISVFSGADHVRADVHAAVQQQGRPPLRPAQYGERVRHLGGAAAADHLTAKRLVFLPLHCITRKGITNTGLDREKTHTVTCSSYQWSTVIFDKHLLFCSLFLLMFIITRQRSLLRSGCCRSPTLQHISGQSWVAFCRGHCVHS